MNCFESRRLLLAAPRERSADHDAHINGCTACAGLAENLAVVDREIRRTTRVNVPDGLADRILLARSRPPRWRRFAIAAAICAAVGASIAAPDLIDNVEPTLAADAVGPAHPAVAAISLVTNGQRYVIDDEHPALDRAAIQERLRHVGLALKRDGVWARDAGKCEVGGRACDHLVLETPEGNVSVFLMANEHPSGSVAVGNGHMTALLSPAPSGAYIVVADTRKAARRAQKLFARS